MQTFDANLTSHTIEMMKRGDPPEAVWRRLMELGAGAEDARTLVAHLVALKQPTLPGSHGDVHLGDARHAARALGGPADVPVLALRHDDVIPHCESRNLWR